MSGDWIISPDCTSYRNAQHPDSTFYCIIYNFIECFISYIVLLYNMIWSQIIEYCMSHIIFYVMINIWSYDTVWNYTYNNYYCIIWYDSMHHRNQYNISISISSLFSYYKIKEASWRCCQVSVSSIIFDYLRVVLENVLDLKMTINKFSVSLLRVVIKTSSVFLYYES